MSLEGKKGFSGDLNSVQNSVQAMRDLLDNGMGHDEVEIPQKGPAEYEADIKVSKIDPGLTKEDEPTGFLDIMAKYLDIDSLSAEDLSALNDGTDGKLFFEPGHENGKIILTPGIDPDGGHTWPFGEGDHVGEGVLDLFAKHIKLGDRDKVNDEISDLVGRGMTNEFGSFLKTSYKSVSEYAEEHGIDKKTPLDDFLKDDTVGAMEAGKKWKGYFAEKDLDKMPEYAPFDITDYDKEQSEALDASNRITHLSKKATRKLEEFNKASLEYGEVQKEYDDFVDNFVANGGTKEQAEAEAYKNGLMDKLQDAAEKEYNAMLEWEAAENELNSFKPIKDQQVNEFQESKEFNKNKLTPEQEKSGNETNEASVAADIAVEAHDNHELLEQAQKRAEELKSQIRDAKSELHRSAESAKGAAKDIGMRGFSAAKAMADPHGNGGLQVVEAAAMAAIAAGKGLASGIKAIKTSSSLSNANKGLKEAQDQIASLSSQASDSQTQVQDQPQEDGQEIV